MSKAVITNHILDSSRRKRYQSESVCLHVRTPYSFTVCYRCVFFFSFSSFPLNSNLLRTLDISVCLVFFFNIPLSLYSLHFSRPQSSMCECVKDRSYISQTLSIRCRIFYILCLCLCDCFRCSRCFMHTHTNRACIWPGWRSIVWPKQIKGQRKLRAIA